MPAISSIQNDSLTLTTTDGTSKTQSITAVDTSRAVIFLNHSSEDGGVGGRDSRYYWAATFSASNQITFSRGSNTSAQPMTLKWTVLEFATGALQSLQTGSVDRASTATDISITTVDTQRAFVVTSFTTTINDTTWTTVGIPSFGTSTGNLLHFESPTAPAAGQDNIRWQVIEFKAADALVQFGSTTLVGTATTANVNITAVDTAQTFIAGFYNGGDTGMDASKARIYLQSATNVRIERRNDAGALDMNITFFAVEMTDGSRVESGLSTMSGTATSPTGGQPSWASAMTNGVVFTAWSKPNLLYFTATTDADTGDVLHFSATLNAAQNGVSLFRQFGTATISDDGGDVALAWQVVEFAAAAGGYAKAGSLVDGARIKYLVNGGLVR